MKRTVYHFSCRPGLDLIPREKKKDFYLALSSVMGSPCRTVFYRNIRDWKDIPYMAKLAMDSLFAAYGVSEDRVWKIWS